MAIFLPLNHSGLSGVDTSPPVRVIALNPRERATAISFSPAQSKVHLRLSEACHKSNGTTSPVCAPGSDNTFGVQPGL